MIQMRKKNQIEDMVDDHVEEAVVDMVQNNFQEMRSLKKVKNAMISGAQIFEL